jgi:ABC-type cobalamin/Fe3+-siderophores transport system ATPase subunit
MLQHLYIDNYRCFVNFELDIDPALLLIGGNGAGKSSVIDVLRLLRDFALGQCNAEDAFTTDSLNWWQDRDEQTFELKVGLSAGTYTYRLVVHHESERQTSRVAQEDVHLDGKPLIEFAEGDLRLYNDRLVRGAQFQLDPSRSGLSFVVPRHDNTKLIAFRNWLGALTALRLNPFGLTSLSEREEERLAVDGSNFASWYRGRLLEDPAGASELLALLQPVLPDLVAICLEAAGRSRALSYRFSQPAAGARGKTQTCDLAMLSEGQRALAVLYAVYQKHRAGDGALVCVDEPDNFLALTEIEPWLNLMRDAADDGVLQFLVSSHHPEVINAMVPDQAMVLSREGSGPARARRFRYDGELLLTPAEVMARGWDDGEA